MSADSPTPLLDRINEPGDLRALGDAELKQLADELHKSLWGNPSRGERARLAGEPL